MSNPFANRNRYRAYAAPDKILVATDLEDIGYLVPHAIAQVRASGAALMLAHVVPPAEQSPLDARAILPADAATMEEEAKRKLEGIAEGVRASGIRCDVVVRHGSPCNIIPWLVETTGANRLILGTHGRQNLKKLLLGSVANEILREVDVPVCTIGPHASAPPPHETPWKILHPVSLEDEHQRSTRVALEIAQFYKAEITLLHVLNRDLNREYDSERVVEWKRSELQRLIPDEAPLWGFSTIQVEAGSVVEQILDVAAEMCADLIVLGVNPDISFWPIDSDHIAFEIIAQAKCPVLTIRRASPTGQSKNRSKKEVPLGIV